MCRSSTRTGSFAGQHGMKKADQFARKLELRSSCTGIKLPVIKLPVIKKHPLDLRAKSR